LAMPVLILGLIYSGVVYATEAAAVAVLYALVASLASGGLKWRDLKSVLQTTAKTTSMLFMLVIGSIIIGGMVSMMGFANQLVEKVLSMNMPVWLIIVVIMALLIALGAYLEPIAMMFIFIPVATPVLKSLHIDLVWFAVLFAVNMEMAIISPPVGTNMNIVQHIAGASYTDVNRGVIPFILVMLLAMVLLGLFPQLSLWLPNIVMGK
jgi:C4-dicarboxylate transporter DctM subunit